MQIELLVLIRGRDASGVVDIVIHMRGAQYGVCLSLIVDACTSGTKRASLTADAWSPAALWALRTAYESPAMTKYRTQKIIKF